MEEENPLIDYLENTCPVGNDATLLQILLDLIETKDDAEQQALIQRALRNVDNVPDERWTRL